MAYRSTAQQPTRLPAKSLPPRAWKRNSVPSRHMRRCAGPALRSALLAAQHRQAQLSASSEPRAGPGRRTGVAGLGDHCVRRGPVRRGVRDPHFLHRHTGSSMARLPTSFFATQTRPAQDRFGRGFEHRVAGDQLPDTGLPAIGDRAQLRRSCVTPRRDSSMSMSASFTDLREVSSARISCDDRLHAKAVRCASPGVLIAPASPAASPSARPRSRA